MSNHSGADRNSYEQSALIEERTECCCTFGQPSKVSTKLSHCGPSITSGCCGGCSGTSRDLLYSFDPQLTGKISEQFITFSEDLTALITGICVASIANIALAVFVKQIQWLENPENIVNGSSSISPREYLEENLPFISAVTLISTSAAASATGAGLVQSVLAGVIGVVRLVSNDVIPQASADVSEEMTSTQSGVALILLLTFTALASRIIKTSFVSYSQCLVAHAVTLDQILRQTSGTLPTIANFILFSIGLVAIIIGLANKLISSCAVQAFNRTDRDFNNVRRVAGQHAATVNILTITATATITAFAVFAANVYTLSIANSSGSVTAEVDFAAYLAPTVVVVARSFVHMKTAYVIMGITKTMRRIERLLSLEDDHLKLTVKEEESVILWSCYGAKESCLRIVKCGTTVWTSIAGCCKGKRQNSTSSSKDTGQTPPGDASSDSIRNLSQTGESVAIFKAAREEDDSRFDHSFRYRLYVDLLESLIREYLNDQQGKFDENMDKITSLASKLATIKRDAVEYVPELRSEKQFLELVQENRKEKNNDPKVIEIRNDYSRPQTTDDFVQLYLLLLYEVESVVCDIASLSN